jgi:hypothetical protein
VDNLLADGDEIVSFVDWPLSTPQRNLLVFSLVLLSDRGRVNSMSSWGWKD